VKLTASLEGKPGKTRKACGGGVASLAGILLTVFLLIGHPSRDDPGSAPFEA